MALGVIQCITSAFPRQLASTAATLPPQAPPGDGAAGLVPLLLPADAARGPPTPVAAADL